jgi:hypothetical protein
MNMPPTVVRTPNLARALADYTQVLGFRCEQHIPGVVAVLSHGSLSLQLWGCGARPGRWEQPDGVENRTWPGHHRVTVSGIHALYASLRRSLLRPVRTGLAGSVALHADQLVQRLGTLGPRLQPWKAWEFSFTDVDGNVLHLIDWSPCQPGAQAPQFPGASSAKP